MQTNTGLTVAVAGLHQETVPLGQAPAKKLGIFLDKASKERIGTTVGMSQPFPAFSGDLERLSGEVYIQGLPSGQKEHLARYWSL